LYEVYKAVPHDDEHKKEYKTAYKNYIEAHDEFLMINHDLTNVFIILGENSIVCPYAFTDCCVKGSAYENAGEIYFIVTDDTVYFQTQRHF